MGSNSVLKRAQAAHTQLSETLYEATAKPEAWLPFMQQLIDVTDSRSARLLIFDKSATQVTRSLKVNIDDSFHRQYVDYYVNACPWRPELKEKPAGQLYSTYMDFSCSQKQFLHTEFYTDWARPQHIHHGMCGTLYEDEQRKIQFLIQRTSEPGHYRQEEKAFVNTMLVPHMRRVCQLSALYTRMEGKSTAIAEATGRSALPFVLLDDSGKAIFTSPGAERIFAENDALTLQHGRLCARRSKIQQQLAQLIEQARNAAQGKWDSAGGLLKIMRPARSEVTLLVSPIIGHSEQLLFSPNQPYVAVFLYEASQHPRISEDILRTLYGLTPAEARVAAGIARGESLEDLAATQHKSMHTLRSQLKAAFKKTNTTQQSQLTHVVLTGPAVKRFPDPDALP